MTTDFLTEKARRKASSGIAAGLTENIANLLHTAEIEGLNKKMDASLTRLGQARLIIEMADAKIARQKARISALEDLATTDDLTGIKNRRGFHEMFLREIERCSRGTGKGGLLIIIDLDHFKAVNDTFGHPAGDAALKLVARTLSGSIRKTDVAARLGGDEFALILADATGEHAAAKVQSIAACLNTLSLAWYGDVIRLRASVGVKAFGAGDRIDAVLQAADNMMYEKKGRKQI